MKKTTIVLVLLLILLGFYKLGYDSGYEEGIITRPVVSIKYISALEEAKRCDEWGGKFYLSSRWGIYPISDKGNWATLKCTKTYTEGNKEINEKLFDYSL